MAQVSLRFYGLLYEASASAGEILEVSPSATWEDVLERVCSRYGSQFRAIVMPSRGTLGPQARILFNGRILTDKDLPLAVGNGGELAFFSAISGG